MDQIISEYYDAIFSYDTFRDAYLNYYLNWCEENKQEPEINIDDFNLLEPDEFEESLIEHILYHAEIYGFDIEEKKEVQEALY